MNDHLPARRLRSVIASGDSDLVGRLAAWLGEGAWEAVAASTPAEFVAATSEPLDLIVLDFRERALVSSWMDLSNAALDRPRTLGIHAARSSGAEFSVSGEPGRETLFCLLDALRYETRMLSQLEALRNSDRIGLAVLDPDGRIRFANRGMSDLFGYEERELLALDHIDAIVPEQIKANVRRLSRDLLSDAQGIRNAVTTWSTRDGELIEVEVSASRFFVRGEPVGLLVEVGALTDEIALRQDAMQEALELYRAESIIGVATELGADVDSLLRAIDAAGTGSTLEIAKAVEDVRGSADELRELLQSFDAFVSALELEEIVRRASQSLQVEGTTAFFHYEVADDLPRLRGSGAVIARVLGSVVDAIGVDLGTMPTMTDVHLICRAAAASRGLTQFLELRFEVCASGGQGERPLPGLFSTSPATAGASGERYDEARRTLEQLGGSLHVEAARGGRRITVVLPAEPASRTNVVRDDPHLTSNDHQSSLLVVEDDIPRLEFMVLTLTDAGYAVTSVTTVAAAARALKREPFDAVIYDEATMHDDETRLSSILQDQLPAPPLVMVGTSEPAGRAAAVVLSPFNIAALLRAVHLALSS